VLSRVTRLLEWQTRVVVRYSTGMSNCSEIVEGRLHEVLALLAVGGLHHGYLGGLGVIAVVLLVLGGVHAGIVGGDDDKAAATPL
jgi:hypothetical protein